ncbi:MAG: hypothetical protein JWO32_918 [Bacteroidetes bacterium]|nr:hypothetical protein [Bacteroidota bacterium]
MKRIFFIIFLFVSAISIAQSECTFIKDTLTVAKENKVVTAEMLQTTFKNKTVVQIIKTEAGKYYLKFIVFENLYFNRIDLLEIKSGTKSFYAKETTQYRRDKYSGFYLIEIYKNYIGTLRQDGVTSIVFNKAETIFTKQDCELIKQMAKCFYDAISPKK